MKTVIAVIVTTPKHLFLYADNAVVTVFCIRFKKGWVVVAPHRDQDTRLAATARCAGSTHHRQQVFHVTVHRW